VVQALSSVVGVCHGNLRVAWDTVQMEKKTLQKCLRKDNIGVVALRRAIHDLTTLRRYLTCCQAFLQWHHSSCPSPGTSVMFPTLHELHTRPPPSCHTQRNRLQGDISMATTHVQLQLHISALFFLITFTIFRWYSLFWEIIFMGKGLRSWNAT